MKAIGIGSCFLFLIGNEILSMMAVMVILIAFILTIMKERVEK